MLTLVQTGSTFTGTLEHPTGTCRTKGGQIAPPPWALPYRATLAGRVTGRALHFDQVDDPPDPAGPVTCPKNGTIQVVGGVAVQLETVGRCDLQVTPVAACDGHELGHGYAAVTVTTAMTGSEQCDEGLVPVPGGRVHWRRFGGGSGLPVLMVHGGPGLTSRYLDRLAGLADERPVFTWDQLECGRSDRPHDRALWVLERFVDELDAVRNALTPGPVHVLGHSWGATLAIEWLVARRPVNVASVVFASPCLDTPRWIRDTRQLIAGLSAEAQEAITTAERTGCFDTPGTSTPSGTNGSACTSRAR